MGRQLLLGPSRRHTRVSEPLTQPNHVTEKEVVIVRVSYIEKNTIFNVE